MDRILTWLQQPWHAQAIVALLAAGAGAWLMWRLLAWLRRRRLARMRRLGREGEDIAAGMLDDAGYRIISAQAERTAHLHVDGETVPFVVRADYLVERGSRRWVAEVKAGDVVCDPAHRDTRRQLLEYRVIYHDMAGVLLVDVPARKIREIAFPMLNAPTSTTHPRWRAILIGGLAGIIIGGGLGAWLMLRLHAAW